MNNNLPVISIINCTKCNACKEIYEELSMTLKKNDGSFMIDNKYYSAKIKLEYNSFETNNQISPETEAVLFIFDMSESESFDFIKEKLNIVEEINPLVKLLICNNFVSSNVLSTQLINDWVIANDFELIEIENSVSHSDDEDNDFPEIVGLDRIIEVLNCNSWSNSILNDIAKNSPFAYNALNADESDLSDTSSDINTEIYSKNMDTHMREYTDPLNNSYKVLGDTEILKQNMSNTEISCEKTKEISNNIDSEDFTVINSSIPHNFKNADMKINDDFEELFQNLHEIKEKATQLSFDDRKKYAEEMVKKFWLSMGGDENEFDELSEEELFEEKS